MTEPTYRTDERQTDLEWWVMKYQVDELDHFRASVICTEADGKIDHDEALRIARAVRLRDAARGMAMPVNPIDTQRMDKALSFWPMPQQCGISRMWLYGFLKSWLISHDKYEDEDEQ